MERGDDRKKRRVMELAIVERVKQGLPLQKDALEYLIAYFNLDSLNNFCRTSWTMQQFCENNQIWRKKFARHIPTPGSGNWLESITRAQWLHYWDFLSTTRCLNQYRLLVAFLSVFRHYQKYSNPETDVTFYLDIEFGDRDYLDRIRDYPIYVENEIGFIVPIVLSCSFDHFDENMTFRSFSQEDVVDAVMVVEEMGWASKFYPFKEEDDDAFSAPPGLDIILPRDVTFDAVTIVYKFIGKGYLPQGLEFKTITARIGAAACAHCATPKAKTVCGSCQKIAYCGQTCAQAHWQEHNCK
jgi:hypothetical protein